MLQWQTYSNDAPPTSYTTPKDEIAALRRELAQMRSQRDFVIEHTSAGYWEWCIQDNQATVSPHFWEIFGYTSEEAPHPDSWCAQIHPDDLFAVKACYEEHIATRGAEPIDQRVRCRHKDGHWVTVRCRGEIVEWADDGTALRMAGTQTDITRLVEARTRAEILYSASSVGIWDWIDLEQTRQYWNPQFYELIGYDPDELESSVTNFRELLHPDDVEGTFAMVDTHLAGESDFEYDYRLLQKGGGYRWFRGTGKAVFNEAGKAIRMVGSIQDIHDARLAQEKIKALVLRHTLSLKASGIGVWDWDVTSNRLVWDEQMYRLYGADPKNFGSAFDAWLAGVHPDDRADGELRIARALSGEEEFNTKFRVVTSDGSVRWIRAFAKTIRDANGNATRMVGVNLDITERETHEAVMKAAADKLRDSNEELERFVYFASHDLQAPIRHVTAFTQLLTEKLGSTLDDEGKQWFDFVTLGAERMQRLVEDLLAYARAGRETDISVPVPLDEVLVEVTGLLSNEDGSKRIRVEATALPTVVGHRSQLHQVLQNLLENAAKYARPDVPPVAKISAEENATHWVLHVQDNGQGIPNKYLEKIFEPFQKLSSDDPKSSGIGLAICTKVAQRHGGEMSITSEPGVGSTFSMSIRKPLPQPHDSSM